MKRVAQHASCGDESDFSVSIDVGQIRLNKRGFTRFDKRAQVVECRLMLSGEALYSMRPCSDRRLYNDVAAISTSWRCDMYSLRSTTVVGTTGRPFAATSAR